MNVTSKRNILQIARKPITYSEKPKKKNSEKPVPHEESSASKTG